ncbi:MAG: hypothetical protein IE909_18825 [Campylobacterales bacterium]|nr:hypothetical protein [Campylobacterales bacterium]
MSQFIAAGKITSASLRNFIIEKKVDKGESLILNATDYSHLIEDIKQSGDAIDVPLYILGVLIAKDTSNEIPAGKIQIVSDDKM